jgi:hypothetical protein
LAKRSIRASLVVLPACASTMSGTSMLSAFSEWRKPMH